MKTNRCHSDRGSAVIEFVVLGLLAQIVIVAIALPAMQQQRVQLAANSLVSQVARVIAQDPTNLDRIQELVAQQTSNYELGADSRVSVEVSPELPHPGQLFTVRVQIGTIETTDTRRMPR
ncbi:MAG: hypothetical protein ACKORF_06175 [Micrococcales bacterium]